MENRENGKLDVVRANGDRKIDFWLSTIVIKDSIKSSLSIKKRGKGTLNALPPTAVPSASAN
jgi:hypothetical protein